MRFYGLDLLDLGTRRLSWRRLGSLLRFLPREAATVQEVVGDDATWSDQEYLSALLVDSVTHLGWMFTQVHFKNPPRKPPPQVRRPGDRTTTKDGVTRTVNLSESTKFEAGSLSFAEMDAAIARQTGVVGGVARGEG